MEEALSEELELTVSLRVNAWSRLIFTFVVYATVKAPAFPRPPAHHTFFLRDYVTPTMTPINLVRTDHTTL